MSTPIAVIKPHFGREYKAKVARITRNWIVIWYNDIATGKFSRKDGYSAGAFKSRQDLTPSKCVNLEELNKLANDNGGTWYPPKKAKPVSG